MTNSLHNFLHFKCCIPFISTVCNFSSFPHNTETPYIQHPYSPQRFDNLRVILYFTKCPIFSIINSNAVNVALTHVEFADIMNFLFLKASFTQLVLDLILCVYF